jgi:hypothetical protein
MKARQIIFGLCVFCALAGGREAIAQNAASGTSSTSPPPGLSTSSSAPSPSAPAAVQQSAASAPGGGLTTPPVEDKADTPDNADPSKDPLMAVSISQSRQNMARLKQPDVKPEELTSLFFTLWQYQLLQDAKRLYVTHPVSKEDLARGGDATQSRPRSIRELSVGGILYRGPEDWTVYLNGQRITEDKNSLPEQVMDIKVTEDHIDLKWFDTFTNLIFPVRLREHQRFNLDARMFITGQGTQTAGTQ